MSEKFSTLRWKNIFLRTTVVRARLNAAPLVTIHRHQTDQLDVGAILNDLGQQTLSALLWHAGADNRMSVRNHYETILVIFRSGQSSGNQRSSKVKFCPFQHFSTNRRITRVPEELQRHWTAHSIALLWSVGIAMTNIEVRSLDVTWWPDLDRSGSEIFAACVEMVYQQVCQKRRRGAHCFLTDWKI